MSNNEKFNALLNSCSHAQQVYNALLTFAKPSLQQTDNVSEKRKIIIGELLSLLNQAESTQQII